ncbi:hypothetical protein FSP39_005261 [Pinctada imbricata]|uniref:ATP-dependent DNA helicase n=1 Tax=Pinctada imbricata TaxID=66713 RepID=A0AA88XEQ2_PINIB|nr:hypothetical protein FSP39_005261 [Pinctada imbricata]
MTFFFFFLTDSSQHKKSNPLLHKSAEIRDDESVSGYMALPPLLEGKSSAFMRQAPLPEEMSLATSRLASQCENLPHNAGSLASSSGSRLISQNRDMPVSIDSTNVVCTSLKVPSPQAGVAAQSQTGVQLASMAVDSEPSIKKENKRMQQDTLNNIGRKKGKRIQTNQSNEYNKIKGEKSNEVFDMVNGNSRIINQAKYKCVQGHFHQGNHIFGDSAGNQCVANCFIAALYKLHKSMHDWDPYDMNTILMTGNELYCYLQASSKIHHSLLMAKELPSDIEVFSQRFQTKIHESVASVIDQQEHKHDLSDFHVFYLKETLEYCLNEDSTCFLCFANSTILIGKEFDDFFVFDPHARSNRGLLHSNGTSTCLMFHNLDNVCSHILQLAVSMGVTRMIQCEITRATITVITQCESELQCDQEFEKPQDDKDVQYISSSVGTTNFTPLPFDKQSAICSKYGFSLMNKTSDQIMVANDAGQPKKCQTIHGDGNCFFRAISFSVSNFERNHMIVRSLVCKHALSESTLFQSYLRNSSEDVKSYINRKRMQENGSWATEFEIIVTAHMLQCNIYTFSNSRWLVYKPPGIHQDRIRGSIYLEHINGNHYNVVQNVETTDSICQNTAKKVRLEKLHNEMEAKKEKNAQRRLKRAQNSNPYYNKNENKSKLSNPDNLIKQGKPGEHQEECHYLGQIASKSSNDIECQTINKDKCNEKTNTLKGSIGKLNKTKKRIHPSSKKEEHLNLRNEIPSKRKREENSDCPFETLIRQFRFEAKKGPIYVCACCHRLLFDYQVNHCEPETYCEKNAEAGLIAKGCISDKYKHVCTKACNDNCKEGTMWICKTCHKKLLNGKVPAESFANGLLLEDVPECLAILNRLEKHLVAKHISFMKIMTLPQGGQNAVRGPVVCVPVNMDAVTKLPRNQNTDLILRVKLKRKLCYKGYYEYQFVNTTHVHKALQYLLEKNKWYKDVEIEHEPNGDVETVIVSCQSDKCKATNQSENDSNRDDISHCKEVAENSKKNSKLSDTNEYTHCDQLSDIGDTSVQYDTCLQPCDIGQEVLDHFYDEIFSLAPAEGMNPVRILQSRGNEAMSFPTHFPSGVNTFDQERTVPITLSRYYNNRLMHADGRFANDTNYIFYSQYVSELKQVIDKTQICLRKAKSKSSEGNKVTEDVLLDNSKLRKILHNDEALRFLQPIRGTPSYWQNTQKDLFAMLRQIGIPTWFCSFSAAEFRWPEIVNAILRQQRSDKDFYDLNWNQKSTLLKHDPVTVARMFDRRFHLFLKMVIFSDLEPIGKVTDYFYRVEFQQRGSPHVHCLFWIKDAPKIEDGLEKVAAFIDKYVTCRLPSMEDDELRDIVENVQCHSKKHSKSCKKGNKTCRFNFPRPPSEKTFIAQQKEECNPKKTDNTTPPSQEDAETDMTCEQAKEILKTIWEGIQDEKIESCSDLYRKVAVSQNEFENAYNIITSKRAVVLKREPSEVWINQYNPILLHCWNANMDIQYVLDAFSCIVYIVSYISKGEREMGMILKQTQIEAQEGNLSAQQTMKKVGTAYLNHREVGVQEAVYRICGLHMKECSRQVVFIPVGENPVRLSRPLAELRKKNKNSHQERESTEINGDAAHENVWMANSVDKYLARPQLPDFEMMCLAVFCSAYRVLAKTQVPKDNKNVYQLQHDMGFIQKRTRSDNAIIRYFRANAVRSPEAFYRCLLQLFLPYWFEKQLKPPGYELYESFYKVGCVRFANDSTLYNVKDIVDANKSEFVRNEETINKAEERYEQLGNLEDAWGNLCPESEKQRHECITKNNERTDENDVPVEFTTELGSTDTKSTASLFTIDQGQINKQTAEQILQSLNEKQRSLFFFIREWCIKKLLCENPDPFYFFVTGGAGTGKSHLISAIKYEASRLLSRLSSEPEKITIVLSAFTGTAAFNISGCTLHHIFKLKKRLPLPYEPLTEQALSPLRSSLENLEILVIDEVSMIYKRLMYYIHERLVQIKRIKAPFGGVSILAVGDFFQLPPVKQPKQERLYNSSTTYPVDYWNELFNLVELNEIMRQKDDKIFAEMLNYIRTRTSDKPLPTHICEMLKSRQMDGPKTALRIFSTNNEVNSYNTQLINSECDQVYDVQANDYKKDNTSGKYVKLEKTTVGCQNVSNSSDQLPSSLLLAPGARVMLTRNVNVADGLANGVIGTVQEIIVTNGSGNSNKQVKVVRVIFDDERVGKNSGKKINDKIVVDIERVEDEPTRSCIVRHQFPLKLAWACTAHKVQGMTCTEIVVNLDKVFSPGQAYVAISRATKLNGLYLQYSNDKILDSKIYADTDVQTALTSMKDFTAKLLDDDIEDTESSYMKIILHNIQNLASHIQHLRKDDRFFTRDAIFLTETWIEKSTITSEFSLEDFVFHHKTRADSYTCFSPQALNMKLSKGGGICVFCKKESDVKYCDGIVCTDIEVMITSIFDGQLYIAVVYNPPSYPTCMFLNSLVEVISKLRKLSRAIIVLGDFNENALKSEGPIQKKMKELGFNQIVKARTTEQGTLLDHVYISESVKASCSIVPTFYSYHEAVAINIYNQTTDTHASKS